MRLTYVRCRIAFLGLSLLAIGLARQPVSAQITPDPTIGAEASQSVPAVINGLPADRIEGGARRGINLFHSFREFNVSNGRGVYFANPTGVQTILTRVTGGNPSAILGTLGVLGNANLILLNPNGVLFGPNARLDLRGAFLATTADSVLLSDGIEFSATNPAGVPPLLTVSIPIGLRFRANPAPIANQSVTLQGVNGVPLPVGLAVDPGRTLALIGGDLNLSGNLTAFQGTVHLGSVASPGVVGLVPTPTSLEFDYAGISQFGKIDLAGIATVTASGLGGGAIALRGGEVTLRDRSSLVADTLGGLDGRGITIDASQFTMRDRAAVVTATVGTGAAGNITVRATDSVELSGIGFAGFRQVAIDPIVTGTLPNLFDREFNLSSATTGAGNAGNVTIDTRQLTLREGVIVSSPTLGAGAGGKIAIRATDSVEVSGSGLFTTAFGAGNAGAIALDTRNLLIQAESTVTTASFGAGNGGDLSVRAADSVTLIEAVELSPFGTNLSTSSVQGTGNAGNLEVNTRSLLIQDGATITSASGATATGRLLVSSGRGGNITINATDSVTVTGTSTGIQPSRSQIATSTVASAPAGDLRINTRRLRVRDGGGIGASTVGAGQGGNIFINATELVEVSGKASNAPAVSGIATTSGDPLVESFFPGQLNPTGAAGNINIHTDRLRVQADGTINVSSLGTGRAGTINVTANTIDLNDRGSIEGTTIVGTGGNINLEARDILLRRGSRISTDAGAGSGGNIRLDSEILVAVPQENNDITANARTDQGGRVVVNVPFIFGLAAISREQVRTQLGLSDAEFANLTINPTLLLPSSDIAAISQAAGPALQGTIVFNTSGINPAENLVELPQTIVDPNALIAANPCVRGSGSEFVITGRGGLPPNPQDPLSDRSLQFTWIEPAGTANQTTGQSIPQTAELSQTSVQPAQGWVINDRGEVTLIAAANSTVAPPRHTWRSPAACPPR